MLRLIAYTWAAPNTVLGAIAGLAMLCLGGHVRVVSGVAEFHGGLMGRYLASFRGGARFGAITLGHVIVGIDGRCLCVLRDHEHAHVRQCERWGLFFLPAYVLSSLWECMHGRNAYWSNWFERQARAVEAATCLRRGGEFTGDIRAGATRPQIPAPGDVDTGMKRFELKVPPLLVFAAFAAAMVALARAFPAASVALPLRIPVAIALTLLGGAIAIAGVIAFRAHRTTVNPMRPESAAIVVTGGVYRFSRNPMYLGLLLALAGLAVYVSSALAMLLLPAFVACMNRMQIEPEERALAARFGAQYASYRARVRRWI